MTISSSPLPVVSYSVELNTLEGLILTVPFNMYSLSSESALGDTAAMVRVYVEYESGTQYEFTYTTHFTNEFAQSGGFPNTILKTGTVKLTATAETDATTAKPSEDATLVDVYIVRDSELANETDWTAVSRINTERLEDDFDRIYAILQTMDYLRSDVISRIAALEGTGLEGSVLSGILDSYFGSELWRYEINCVAATSIASSYDPVVSGVIDGVNQDFVISSVLPTPVLSNLIFVFNRGVLDPRWTFAPGTNTVSTTFIPTVSSRGNELVIIHVTKKL